MRVLVTIVGQGSICHIIRSGILDGLQKYCTPVVALLWEDASLQQELTLKGIEHHVFPPFALSDHYKHLRAKIDAWYFANILKTSSTGIQRRYLAKHTPFKKVVRNAIKNAVYRAQHFLPGFTEKLLKREGRKLPQEEVYQHYAEWLDTLQIDGLYTVTPFLYEVEVLARICKSRQLPIVASVHSFDNVTKRPWPGIFFDQYLVWNKYNKAELTRINPCLKENISITGVPQFDLHFNPDFLMSKASWLKKAGLPSNKKIILYGGGPVSLFPTEPQYLQHITEAIAEDKIRGDVIVLFRSHPLDKVERWKTWVGKSEALFYQEAPNGTTKLDYTNVTDEDLQMLIATLAYTDVHINLCSTMSVDGSVFNKPQIGPAYDEVTPKNRRSLRAMYEQEHYVPIISSGNVHLAHSRNDLVQLVNKALKNPGAMTQNALACVQEIITYTDGKSAPRVIDKLETFFSR